MGSRSVGAGSAGARFVGAREIELWFGVSRQRIQQLIARPDWPAPCAVLAMGKIWLREDIAAWAAQHRPELPPDDDPDACARPGA